MVNNASNRLDLSEWIIHFVHDRKGHDDMYVQAKNSGWNSMGTLGGISYFTESGEPVDLTDSNADNEYEIKDYESAFGVLCKIVHDGYIRSGWSFRKDEPTIYGPFSAVCFTEMPLHALIHYAKTRGAWSGYVGCYGIALKRSELFKAGARPVIYGLSSEHKEATAGDAYYGHGLRTLAESCGIGLNEQYRYVATNLDDTKYIDWMHEREWRWPIPREENGIAGMSFLLTEEWGPVFSEVVILVLKDEEQRIILDQLKNMYDSKCRNCGIDYNVELIPAVKVLSLESLSQAKVNLGYVRIDDVPYLQAKVRTDMPFTEEQRKRVVDMVTEAGKVYDTAIDDFRKANPDYKTPLFRWGAAYIYTEGITLVSQVLLNEGIANTYADGKYIFHVGQRILDDMDLEKIGAEAAAKFLTQQLGQKFEIKIYND